MSIRKGQIIVAGAGNTRRNIGEVYYSQSSLATDNSGALPLWTGESVSTAMYPSLTEWVTKHTELQCTAEEYESALSTYGECPKYVVSNGSLRLPKLANYIKMANAAEGITQSEAGLPNITGASGHSYNDYGDAEQTGAFYPNATPTSGLNIAGGDSGGTFRTLGFDASLSSEVYGKSDTVTPSHTTLFPWVFAYNATVPASTAQAAEFQQGLSGKADANLGNIPTNYDYVVESYSDEEGNWYRLYKSGWIEQGGKVSSQSSLFQVSLLKPYANTLYSVIASVGSTTGNLSQTPAEAWPLTESAIQIGQYGGSNTYTLYWETKGQGE